MKDKEEIKKHFGAWEKKALEEEKEDGEVSEHTSFMLNEASIKLRYFEKGEKFGREEEKKKGK